MVSVNTHKTNILPFWDVRGKSTDVKPVSGIPNGSTFIEIDTAKGYLFDAELQTWEEIPEGSAITIDPAKGVSF